MRMRIVCIYGYFSMFTCACVYCVCVCVCVRVLFACMFADDTCNAQVLEIPARPFRGRVVSATRNPVSLMPHAYAQKSTHKQTAHTNKPNHARARDAQFDKSHVHTANPV